MPFNVIIAKTEIKAPPSTGAGIEANTEPNLGKKPQMTKTLAPKAIHHLLTTLVIATSPTFWLNYVIGKQPNTEDNELTKPSQAIEPEVSLVVASLFKPEDASADVSPIVKD